MDIPDFLNALKDVATSPYAFVGYALVVCVWIMREWFVSQPQKKAAVILKQYTKDEDRTNALRELVGTAPPKGLKPDEILDWVKTKAKEKSRILLLIAYLSTLVVALIIGVIAIKESTEHHADKVNVPSFRTAVALIRPTANSADLRAKLEYNRPDIPLGLELYYQVAKDEHFTSPLIKDEQIARPYPDDNSSLISFPDPKQHSVWIRLAIKDADKVLSTNQSQEVTIPN
jgi:hypothetical protein